MSVNVVGPGLDQRLTFGYYPRVIFRKEGFCRRVVEFSIPEYKSCGSNCLTVKPSQKRFMLFSLRANEIGA